MPDAKRVKNARDLSNLTLHGDTHCRLYFKILFLMYNKFKHDYMMIRTIGRSLKLTVITSVYKMFNVHTKALYAIFLICRICKYICIHDYMVVVSSISILTQYNEKTMEHSDHWTMTG